MVPAAAIQTSLGHLRRSLSLSRSLANLSHLKLPEVVLGLPFEKVDFLEKLLLVVLELAHGVKDVESE